MGRCGPRGGAVLAAPLAEAGPSVAPGAQFAARGLPTCGKVVAGQGSGGQAGRRCRLPVSLHVAIVSRPRHAFSKEGEVAGVARPLSGGELLGVACLLREVSAAAIAGEARGGAG